MLNCQTMLAIAFACMFYFVSSSEYHQAFAKRQNSNKLLNFEYNSNKDSILLEKLINKNKQQRLYVNKFNFNVPNDNPSQNYNLKNKSNKYFSQIYQDRILMHLLNTTQLNAQNASHDGIFLEAGAYDGETHSNTLFLEKYKNWTGLLVEPSVENYRQLLNKKRNSYSINSCLCAGKTSLKSSFIEAGPFGITMDVSKRNEDRPTSGYSITCHPLANILDQFFENFQNLKKRKSKISGSNLDDGTPIVIDYMSLDIEGNEKAAIETFPWKKYQFNLMNIEYNQNKEFYEWLKNYFISNGYKETIVDDVWYQDIYLAHESIYDQLNLNISKVSDFVKTFI